MPEQREESNKGSKKKKARVSAADDMSNIRGDADVRGRISDPAEGDWDRSLRDEGEELVD